jgi:hypothetical protein
LQKQSSKRKQSIEKNIYVIFIYGKKKRNFCLYVEKTKNKKGGKKR